MTLCYLCDLTIDDGQAIRIKRIAGETKATPLKIASYYHRLCARSLIDVIETENHSVVVADPIGPRVNRYGEVVNDNGSWVRVPGTVQCQTCGFVLIDESDTNPYGDPDCPRCGDPNAEGDTTSDDDGSDF